MLVRQAWALLVAAAVAVVACSSGEPRPPATAPATPLDALLASTARDRWLDNGIDPWEVWICHVPLDSTVAVYGNLQLRLPLTPEGVAAVLQAHVPAYFDAVSHGAYRPVFSPGGELTMTPAETPESCLAAAAQAARAGTRGVIAVADAEHAMGQPGGFGKAGEPCAQPPCTEQQTGRGAYVGAADFHPLWGDRPPMDLVEHEIGHALGWPHSGVVDGAAQPYQSGIDLMSDSAAPRAVDADRRDGPDTIAVDRLAAGWLVPADVAVVEGAGRTVALWPSTGPTGTRVAVVALDAQTFLTVEVLAASGFDGHLAASGVAVHRVRLAVRPGEARTQQPLVGAPPFTELLTLGRSIVADGWQVVVSSTAGDVWQVAITPSAG
ncbi:MAG: hypothetical protein JWM12_1904 [Ilumatobacteraceae bacterium]|nr:hypothetical protein [Ilumatobacteraceae bacterium]